MRLSGSRWIGFGVVVAGVAAGSLMAVSASIPSADGTLSTCIATAARTSRIGAGGPVTTVDLKGTMRAVDTEAGEVCGANEQPLTLNLQGGGSSSGEVRWVIMHADGTVHSSNFELGEFSGRTQTGVYSVQFDRQIVGCAPVATPTRIDLGPASIDPLIPLVTKTSNTQFEVVIFTAADTLADSQFSLVVNCMS